jgi:hypothetical protein
MSLVQESGSFETAQKVPKKSIRFLGKIGFLKPNRISQPVPKRAQKLKNQSAAQEIHPIFWKNRISQTVCPNVPKN